MIVEMHNEIITIYKVQSNPGFKLIKSNISFKFYYPLLPSASCKILSFLYSQANYVDF